MADEKKGNAQRVKDYHAKLTEVKLRIPTTDEDIVGQMRARAKELGLINMKGKDAGEGSVNLYLLHLIEKDLGIVIQKGVQN